MSYYNQQQQPPVGVPPPQGYPKDAYPPPGYPVQGYPPQSYPPQGYPPQQQYAQQQYAQQPPRQQKEVGFLEGWSVSPPLFSFLPPTDLISQTQILGLDWMIPTLVCFSICGW
ncbi:unnamed protein product [Linum tenue]|uniref:Rhodopsin n=1 Tax=Linum tenue TaxID=586396 RepID=A0AAV0L867_9ROSI|nr:unnamed protein product [Linum tenue]